MPFRLLIRTHHITSPHKLHKVRLAAGRNNLSLLLRIGRKPPGLMLAEGPTEADVRAWQKVVRELRYKNYQSVRAEEVQGGIGEGTILSCEDMKEWTRLLDRYGILGWWKQAMGHTS